MREKFFWYLFCVVIFGSINAWGHLSGASSSSFLPGGWHSSYGGGYGGGFSGGGGGHK